jgi:succinyl-CoA synthetase beta subunit
MKNLNRSLSNFKSLFTKNKYSLYIHEYQAYDILKKYKLPLVPVIFCLICQSFRASTPEDAYSIAHRLMSDVSKNKPFVDLVIKAQVHAGGRGKGTFKESGLKGGVQTATKASEILEFAEKMIGKTLVTPQTGSLGKKCNDVFLVEKIFLRKELYLSFLLDRGSGSIAVVASPRGGMNIEEV